uniref:Uncharacterized protein n=1 Tax=Fagus sylvatica TaxID=28930 RepID=A0A2N9HC26_FAGSY
MASMAGPSSFLPEPGIAGAATNLDSSSLSPLSASFSLSQKLLTAHSLSRFW